MEKYNRIYIFFLVVALLIWNPFSFYLFYSGTGINTSKILLTIIAIIFFSGFTAILLIRRNKIGERFKNITLFFSFMGILYSAAVLSDRIIGKAYDKKVKKEVGLVGLPNTSAKCKTIEYDVVHHFNNIGICDRDVKVQKDKYRVLCIGDSWTMGEGVNVENSWPKKLEIFLQKKGLNIEVLNCGQAGMYPTGYRGVICKALPLLKPDLVIVGVLQFEDLAQEYEFNYEIPGSVNVPAPVFERIRFAVGQFIHFSFINYIEIFRSRKTSMLDISGIWANDVKDMLQHANQLQKLRYACYEDSIQQLMQNGNFNSVLVNYYMNFPERKFIFNNPHNRATVFAANQLLKDVQAMRTTCDSFHCKMVFVNLPFPDFTGHDVFRIPELDKFDIYFVFNNHIDSIYRSVAERVDVPYIELTQKFKSLKDKKAYFYRYDNHPNVQGYEEIAKTVSDSIVQYINH